MLASSQERIFPHDGKVMHSTAAPPDQDISRIKLKSILWF